MDESATPLDVLHAIAEQVSADAPIEVGTMFRSPGLRTGDKIVAFLGHENNLIVKLPPDTAKALVANGRAAPVTMGARTMREWVGVAAGSDPDSTLAEWTSLVRQALAYVRPTD